MLALFADEHLKNSLSLNTILTDEIQRAFMVPDPTYGHAPRFGRSQPLHI